MPRRTVDISTLEKSPIEFSTVVSKTHTKIHQARPKTRLKIYPLVGGTQSLAQGLEKSHRGYLPTRKAGESHRRVRMG